MKKACARCRKEVAEKNMTRREASRGLYHFYCQECNEAIEAGLRQLEEKS